MLRPRSFTGFCLILPIILLAIILLAGFYPYPASSTSSTSQLRRITSTSEDTLNLNPSLSGDGRRIAFESTGDLAGVGGGNRFHAIHADISANPLAFGQVGSTRAVTPAVSQDGSRIAFASNEDLLGTNADRNSEIFLFDGVGLKQLTNTTAADLASRVNDGNFQPSITDDGRLIAFSSNRNLVALNADLNFEIFIFDTVLDTFTQITNSERSVGATDAKIGGDGSYLAFVHDPSLDVGTGTTKKRDLLLYNLTNGSKVTLGGNVAELALTYGRAISDDGLRVVYSAEIAANQSQVFLFDGRSDNTRQITALGTRVQDVSLHPTISGDGKRITFATRRNATGGNGDGSVELYLYDIPTAQLTQLTSAPSTATAEVISSLNDDGTTAVFSFPRVLSGSVSSNDRANNSEVYVTTIESRPTFGTLSVLNAASRGNEPGTTKALAPDSIAIAQGNALAITAEQTPRTFNGSFPLSIAGTTVTVSGVAAEILYASPSEVHFVVPALIPSGTAEVILTNSERFQSRATVTIASVAPGVFTVSSDGQGQGVILNADTLLSGPFDPTDGNLRLIIFATGVRGSTNLSAAIADRSITVESFHTSPDLPGLDEIHMLVPRDLRGAGPVGLLISADNQDANTVELVLAGRSDLVINEVLADPPDGSAGDANHDGARDASQDEFIELVNTTANDIDISGYELQTRSSSGTTDTLRHRFAASTVLSAGTAVVVFGGGNPQTSNIAFAGAQIFKASSGGLSLLNSGGVATLRNPSGVILTLLSYGGSTGLRGDANESLTRSPDVTGSFVLHRIAPGSGESLFSPGTHVDGTPFPPRPAISQILISPSIATLEVGGTLQLSARALDQNAQELAGVIFIWRSDNTAVATVDPNGLVSAISAGVAQISAAARGVQSVAAGVTVVAPSPTPTPTTSPTPTHSPTPSPSPSPTASPSPTPLPIPIPTIVISEFRTRGPSGASDEFVELYNNSDAAVDISGWKIRGSNNAGSISTRMTIDSGVILAARGHFLAINSVGYSGSVTADQTYSSGIANDGGIALTLANDLIVDQVGLSAGSGFKEGMHLAPLPSDANQSYERKPGGATGSTADTSDNFTDFQLLTPSDPQNRHSAPTPSPSPPPTPSPSPDPSPSPSPSPSPGPSPSPAPSPTPSPSPSPISTLVISQIYGGGGNSGAPFKNDFIEIFNRGETTVSLAGWSVQYASGTGTTWSATSLTPVALAPGQYYLIQESSGGGAGANLPTPDATGTIAMAATAGKIVLTNTTAALSGACPADSLIVDLVGYGSTANCFRGTGPTAPPGNSTSMARNSNGCADTQNNAGDFTAGAPSPRNTGSTTSLCPGSGSSLLILAGLNSAEYQNPWCALVALLSRSGIRFEFREPCTKGIAGKFQ